MFTESNKLSSEKDANTSTLHFLVCTVGTVEVIHNAAVLI
jgi:hypothetical protein